MADDTNKKQGETNRLLSEENKLLRERLKLQSESLDMSSSLVESLKETLGIRSKQTTFESNLLSVNKDINKAIFNQKSGLSDISTVSKQIAKNNELITKSLTVEASLSQQISSIDKSRVEQINRRSTAIEKQSNDLAKIMAMSKEERDIRKDEISSLQLKIAKNEKYLDTSLKNLSTSGQQLLYSRQQRQELEKQNAEREKENKILKNIDERLGAAGKFTHLLSSIPGIGKYAEEALHEVTEEIKDAAEQGKELPTKFGAMKMVLGGMAGQVSKILTDPLTLTFGAVHQIGHAILHVDEGIGKVAKNFGVSYTEASHLKGEMNGIANASGDVNVTTSKLTESMTTLNNAFGTFAHLSEESLVTFTKLTKQAGVSEEAAVALTKTSMLNGQSVEATTAEYLGQTEALKAQTGSAVNTKLVLEDIKNISAATTLSLGNNPKKLAEAAFTARSLGMSLEQVEKVSQSLLDFESSISNELEAELLTGKDLNLEKARAAALNGDLTTAAQEIAKQTGDAAAFGKMNVLQQEALAKSVGMSRDELAKTLQDQAVLNKLKGVEGDTAKDKYETLRKTMTAEQAAKTLGDEALARQFESQSVQERLAASTDKLKEVFVSIAEPVLAIISPFMDMVTTILPAINMLLHPFTESLKFIGHYGKEILGIFTAYKGIQLGINIAKGAETAMVARQLVLEEGKMSLNKLGLALENESLGVKITAYALGFKDMVLEKSKAAWKGIQIGYEATLNGIKKIGSVISKGELIVSIGKAAMGAIASLSAIPFVGWALGLAAAGTATALGYKFLKGDDVMSQGYGKRTLLAGKDAIALNDEDTVVAGTDLGGKKKKGSSESKGASMDISPLVEKMAAVESVLNQILGKNYDIYLDSTKVGTGMAIGTSKVQ
jgi:hypothetical protein